MSETYNKLAESKLIILFLLEKMDIPLSHSQISQFVLEENYMDFFSLQQYLNELLESFLIEKNKTNNLTKYTITDEGSRVLGYFIRKIPDQERTRISLYVNNNIKKIKLSYEIAANYFQEVTNEYNVKCGVYENELPLMEIMVTVATKEHAKQICNNWRENVNKIYGNVLSTLTNPVENISEEKNN